MVLCTGTVSRDSVSGSLWERLPNVRRATRTALWLANLVPKSFGAVVGLNPIFPAISTHSLRQVLVLLDWAPRSSRFQQVRLRGQGEEDPKDDHPKRPALQTGRITLAIRKYSVHSTRTSDLPCLLLVQAINQPAHNSQTRAARLGGHRVITYLT